MLKVEAPGVLCDATVVTADASGLAMTAVDAASEAVARRASGAAATVGALTAARIVETGADRGCATEFVAGIHPAPLVVEYMAHSTIRPFAGFPRLDTTTPNLLPAALENSWAMLTGTRLPAGTAITCSAVVPSSNRRAIRADAGLPELFDTARNVSVSPGPPTSPSAIPHSVAAALVPALV